MNKSVGIQLVIYGLLLAGLSYLAYYLAPSLTKPVLIAGIIGGALSLVWGARAVAGSGGKALPTLTLVAVCFVLLPQTFTTWTGEDKIQGGGAPAVLVTVLFVLSLAMLVRIAWSGMIFDLPEKDSQNAAHRR